MTKKEIHLINPIGYDAKADEKKLSLIFPENRKGKSYFEFPSRYKGNGEGFFFTAQNLSWNLADQQVVCNDGIWLKKGAISGFSQKLQADVALEKVKISGHPKIQVSDTIPTVLEAVDFEVDNPKNILTARNDVVLTANQIKIETKTATYEQSRDLIKLGDRVSASYRQFKALSDFAVYNLKSQMISLTGKPKLLRGSSMLVGDEVSVNIKKKSFSVKGQSKITIPEKELTEESL